MNVYMYISFLTVAPASFITFAPSYMSTAVITPAVCMVYRNTHFDCNYGVILGDGNTVSSATPDLSSSSQFLRQFVSWQRLSNPNAMAPFIDFDLTEVSGISAIELSFFNNPANQISLPDITLSRVVYNTGSNLFSSDMVTTIPSRLLGNQDLTQTDNQVRTVFIRPLIGQSSLNLRISFQFLSPLHNFNTVLVSEVRFCTNPQPQFIPVLAFLAPLSNIVEPNSDDLRRESTELVCTISEQGPYTWQWERDNSGINNSPDYQIIVGDGSRTTKLTINNLAFSSAAEYRCTGIVLDLSNRMHMNSSVQEIQFPGKY